MLPHGPLGAEAVHLAIDMQRMFAEPGGWHVPDMARILPRVAALAAHRPARTVFARFVVPPAAAAAEGAWQRYYKHWADFSGDRLDPAAIGLMGRLDAYAPPATVIDKPAYSAFARTDLHARLAGDGITTLVVSGVETDVCVLATVLRAVDLGYRVIVAADAVASSSPAAHDAVLAHVLPRLDQQIEIADTAAILAGWGLA